MILLGLLILISGIILLVLSGIARLPRSVHYAWVIVAILSVVQIVGQAIGMAAGVMVAPLNDPDGGFGWSLGIIGAGLAMYYMVGAIFSPIAGWLADRYGTRKMMVGAGVSFTTSMVLLGFVSTLWQFFLVFGVLLAFTQSIAMVPMIAAVSEWFRLRLGLAVGLLWAAGGLGSAAIAPAVGFLLENVSWKATFLSIGIVGGAMILVLVPFFRNNPTDKHLRAYGVRDCDPEELSWSKTVEKLRLKTFNQHIRKTKEFWNLPLIHSLGCAGHGIILIYSIPIAVEQGISLTAAAFILSLINIFSIGSRFLTPMIAEKVGGKPAMVAALAIQGVTVMVLFWAGEAWSFYVFAILFGIGFGGEMSAYPVVNRQYFGTGPIGTFYGIEIMGAMVGHAVATALAGFVIFVTGSFATVLVISMGFSFVGVIVVMTLSPSTKVLIPDWELSLPEDARSSVTEARADHDRAALLEQLAVD